MHEIQHLSIVLPAMQRRKEIQRKVLFKKNLHLCLPCASFSICLKAISSMLALYVWNTEYSKAYLVSLPTLRVNLISTQMQ